MILVAVSVITSCGGESSSPTPTTPSASSGASSPPTPEGPAPLGTFTAVVTGAFSETFSGRAVFGSAHDLFGVGSGPMFGLTLDDERQTREINILKDAFGRPETGRFAIGRYNAAPLFGEFLIDLPGGRTEFFLSEAESSISRLIGREPARHVLVPCQVLVTATFSAVCITPGPFSCD